MSVLNRPQPPRSVQAPPGSPSDTDPGLGAQSRPPSSARDRDPTPLYGVPILTRKRKEPKRPELAETTKIPSAVVGEIEVEARTEAPAPPTATIVVAAGVGVAIGPSSARTRRRRARLAKLALALAGMAAVAVTLWAVLGGQGSEPGAASARTSSPMLVEAPTAVAAVSIPTLVHGPEHDPSRAAADMAAPAQPMAPNGPAPTMSRVPGAESTPASPVPAAAHELDRAEPSNQPRELARQPASLPRPGVDQPPRPESEGAAPRPPPPNPRAGEPGDQGAARSVSANRLLAEARKASMTGRNHSAWQLASRSYALESSTAALQVMGVAACKMGDRPRARDAHRLLPSPRRPALEAVCSAHGLEL